MRAQRLPWSRSDCRRVGALAGYAFWLYAFGPALALLRAEPQFSYTMLGSLADHLGLRAAFTIEPVLIGACALLLLAGLRALRRPIPIRTVDNRPVKTS